MAMRAIHHHLLAAIFLCSATITHSEVQITSDHLDNQHAAAGFKLPRVPAPRRGDAGAKATFTLLDGQRDGFGGDLAQLHDGILPSTADQPAANFFFRQGGDGGRIAVDLGGITELSQIHTYSWHAGTRGPQVYRLYVSDGKAPDFNKEPKRPADPAKAGWKLIANVDTRPAEGAPGGQYGVNIADSTGSLGSARYVLLDILCTEDRDPFGNTFFSEIDILDKSAPAAEEPIADAVEKTIIETVEIADGGFRFTVETTDAPDLTDWAHTELIPVIQKWYPILVEDLPSEGYTAPKTFSVTFTNSYKGVAATGGNRVDCSPAWFRQNLHREGLGAVVHELVHVVQQYGRARQPGATRGPGWITEGIPDYLRWYHFEPQSHGADIRPQNAERARYDASYRTSANFLNYVIAHHDKDLIAALNAAMREGRYEAEFWKIRTGHTVEELAEEWKKSLAENPPK